MSTLSYTEENYIKGIYTLQQRSESGEVSVNSIAERMQTRPATVTDMLRKLSDKELIHYEKYRKVRLSKSGAKAALLVIRKHRLWETFLYEKLRFSWDEVHEVAEQLEHIHSKKLIERLDEFLGFPAYDPHGDPIPNAAGVLPSSAAQLMKDMALNTPCTIVAVKDTSSAFLQQLERFGLHIGVRLEIVERLPYDNSLMIVTDGEPFLISERISGNIFVEQ